MKQIKLFSLLMIPGFWGAGDIVLAKHQTAACSTADSELNLTIGCIDVGGAKYQAALEFLPKQPEGSYIWTYPGGAKKISAILNPLSNEQCGTMDKQSLIHLPCVNVAGSVMDAKLFPLTSSSWKLYSSSVMTTVDATSMLQDHVTANVTKIRIVGWDTQGNVVSSKIVRRAAAANFSVPMNWAKVELLLLTEADKQIGKIIFDPDGTDMTLTLPGAGQSAYQVMKQDIVINADLWVQGPIMMAAGLGFTNIIGINGIDTTDVPASEPAVIDAGGTWQTLSGCGDIIPAVGNYTTAVSPQMVEGLWGPPAVSYTGGMPIEFSYPVLLSTAQGTDILVTLNDGSSVLADVGASSPNSDYNERASFVVFGQFGNRLELDDPEVLYPTKIEVVEDDTPMMLVGPGGSLVSAVGMSVDAPGSPYKTLGNGPRLTGAKLTVMSTVGDGGPPGLTASTPNDGIALYGADAQYRLRVFTTGGYTPDGVTGLKPMDYDTYFRVQVKNDAGDLVALLESGKEYIIDGKPIEVVGLAELGAPGQVVEGNDCYLEDKDNQIDIVLKGDVEVMRKIVAVDVPSTEAGYKPFYNPGGPGNTPADGVTYTQGSPNHTVEGLQAIDDPMAVTYIDLRPQ